jgi:hypothetical protein
VEEMLLMVKTTTIINKEVNMSKVQVIEEALNQITNRMEEELAIKSICRVIVKT